MSRSSHRIVSVLACAGVLSLSATHAIGQDPPQQPPVFRSMTDVVSIDVSVRSGSSVIKGLVPADFELLDAGVVQRIDSASMDAVAVDLTVEMDASGSTVKSMDDFKADAHRIAAILRPGDRVRLVTFASEITELLAFRTITTVSPVNRVRSGGGTSVNDALFLALLSKPGPDRRNLIVAFTDGEDTSSILDPATVGGLAARCEGVMHVVLSDAPGRTDDQTKVITGKLREMIEPTGGQVHRPLTTDDVVSSFKKVFTDFRQSYVLRYTPNGVTREGWHDVLVRVTKPGKYTIRARKGYFGG